MKKLSWLQTTCEVYALFAAAIPSMAFCDYSIRSTMGGQLRVVASFAASSLPRRRESIYGARYLKDSPNGFPPSLIE